MQQNKKNLRIRVLLHSPLPHEPVIVKGFVFKKWGWAKNCRKVFHFSINCLLYSGFGLLAPGLTLIL